MDHLKNLLKVLPKTPGVYQFYNKSGEIIYIGKAKNLKARVNSYFTKSKHEAYKIKVLTKQIFSIKHILVENESDALLLENNLIKKYQPKYNVLLKDDKTFPWICIKNEPFPRVFSTRKIIHDGSEYFGPYTSALMVKTLLELIRQIYPLRNCKYSLSRENIKKGKFKRCLEFHLGNCKAPCESMQTEEEYDSYIISIKKILKGNIQEVISHLEILMKEKAAQYKFEEAEKIKLKINLLDKFRSKSTIVNQKLNDIDVFSFIQKEKKAAVNFLKIIKGAIVQSHTIELQSKLDESPQELLMLAIIDIRGKVESTSRNIIVPFLPADPPQEFNFTVPKAGDKKRLLELSERNAKQFLVQKQILMEKKGFEFRDRNKLEQIKNDLHLKDLPEHMECFDNSNIQGANPVAACVVFHNGKPAKSQYRHYNIKTVVGANDFASMEEVVYRRYRRLLDENKSLPGLVVVDGGKGQLNAAVKSLKKLNLYGLIPIVGIAKRLEEIYFPHDPVPLYLDKQSVTLQVIQHMRNEAHRFGIAFHRNKRSGASLKSQLAGISGIGENTINKLIKEFGSVERIKTKSLKELSEIVGLKKAEAIVSVLGNKE